MGLASALVPRFPGINSAMGCTIADMSHDFVQTINRGLDELDIAELDRHMASLAGEGLQRLKNAGVKFVGTAGTFMLDMYYQGQTHTVDVPLPVELRGDTTGVTRDIVNTAFENRYREVYGRALQGIPIRVLNLRVTTVGRRPKFDLTFLAPAPDCRLEQARRGTRRVWVEGAWHEAAIYERLLLPVAATVPGPAILEQPDATVFIEPDLYGEVDRFGNLIIKRKPGG